MLESGCFCFKLGDYLFYVKVLLEYSFLIRVRFHGRLKIPLENGITLKHNGTGKINDLMKVIPSKLYISELLSV